MDATVPLLTTAVSVVFAATLLDQYRRRPRPYTLVWAAGLLLYGLASLMASLHELGSPGGAVFRLWYWSGAMLAAAYLGTGTVYLLASRRVAHVAMAILALATVASLALALGADLHRPLSDLEGQPLTGHGFYPGGVTLLTIVLNIYGTMALVGGALWSAYAYARRGAARHRFASNLLIALGAFLSAAGGSLDRLGLPQPHAVALLAGVVVIYAGFLASQETFGARAPYLWFRRQT